MLSPYLTWTLLFFGLPIVFLWVFFWETLWRYRLVFLAVSIIGIIVGMAWDTFAVNYNIWGWPEECCTLPRLPGNIPAEEIIWAVAASVYSASVVLVIREKLHPSKERRRR